MTIQFGGFPAALPGKDAAVRLNLLSCRRLDGEAVLNELIAADQTDWNPSGLSSAIAIFVTQYVGTGYKINSLAGGAVKVVKVIVNDDPVKNLTLTHNDAGSVAANKFNFTSFNGGSNIVLPPSYAAALEYDDSSSVWNCSAVGIPFPLANDPGEDGALWFTGAGAPSSSPDFGNDNDLYFDTGAFSPDTAGNIWKKSGGSWSLISNIRGPSGSPGSAGSDGADPGVLLVWDTGTSDANPGSGKIRANNASLASATVLYVSKTSKGGSDISAFLASLDDSTNTNKGDLLLTKPSDDTQAGFTVTGITDATGYVKVAVSGPFGATSFSAASPISFQFTRAGDKGLDGLGSGDMTKAVYDPNNVAADAFSQDSMVDGTTNKNYSATEKTKLAGIASSADVTSATNVGSSIHGATAKTSLADGDEVTITDSAASYVLKRITWANVYAAIWSVFGAIIAGGTGKTTPVDADTLALSDSAASNATKKLTWANVKATIKTYTDGFYAVLTRSISAGSGLTGGGDLSADRTISLSINGQSADSSPDVTADYVITYDASASGFKKVLLNLLGDTVNNIKKNVSATLTVGYIATPYSAGTKSSGTFTPDPANGNQQYATNGGAHTLAPPSSACSMVIEYVNNGSAGAVTTSGFTKVTGDTLNTTNGNKFLFFIIKSQNYSHLHVVALQ